MLEPWRRRAGTIRGLRHATNGPNETVGRLRERGAILLGIRTRVRQRY